MVGEDCNELGCNFGRSRRHVLRRSDAPGHCTTSLPYSPSLRFTGLGFQYLYLSSQYNRGPLLGKIRAEEQLRGC